jgi:ATP-binding cassette subfamily B protein
MFNITENVVKLTIKCDDGVIMLKLLNVIVEYCESVNQYTVFIGFIPDRFLANKYPSSIYTLPSLFMSPAIIFGPVFNINPGEIIAIIGDSAAGKSTLAKLIGRFYDPSSGTVELDGVDLRKLSDDDLRKAVVMVTQEAYLFSRTVAENISLGKPEATQEEIENSAKAVGAHEFILSLPDGYNTDVNKRGGRVSAGQRQLISFARAFIANPAVLILDEATSSLDIPSERMVQHGLKTLLADRTAIIIAHRLSTVSIADRVLVMERGRIIEDDSPKNLISGEGKFSKMHKAWRDSLV